MPKKTFTYTNRRGVSYCIHETTTKTGLKRYIAKRSPDGALSELPDGYEIAENVNGRVSVRKIRPRHIPEQEEQLVQKMLKTHERDEYRVESKSRFIIIHEPLAELDQIAAALFPEDNMIDSMLRTAMEAQFGPGIWEEYQRRKQAEACEAIWKQMQYSAVLRLYLEDAKRRLFRVDRMTYRGEGGWMPLEWDLPLADALEKYVPLLGTDELLECL